jgi:hypothetical protein
LSGCSKDEFSAPVNGGNADEIVLRSSVINVNSDQTRAAYEGNDLAAKPLTALVLTSLNPKDYTSLRCEGTMTFDGSNKVAYNKPVKSGSSTFSDKGTTLHYLTGLYPAADWIVSGGDRTLELTGKEDVMLAPEVSTNYDEASKGSVKTLAFTHQLTHLKLKFIQNGSFDEIKLNSAEVVDALGGLKSKAVADITAGTQSVTFEPNAASIRCWVLSDDSELSGKSYDVTSNDAAYAYTLVPPVIASNVDKEYEYTFRIGYTINYGGSVGEKSVSQIVSVDLKNTTTSLTGDSKGKAYTITFKFVDGNIEAAASVAVWDNWGDGEFEI